MHQPIHWNERQDGGTRREVQANVARKRVEWRFRLSTEETWNPAGAPTLADWDVLLDKMQRRYQRRNISHADLMLVTRLRIEAQAAAGNQSL